MNAKLEKVARMMGKTTYKDFREGFASRSLAQDSDADIKAALGMAQRAIGDRGALAIQALETRYASTLVHERVLRRAWDREVRQTTVKGMGRRTPHTAAVQRLACALAIRRHAGARMIQLEVAEYAWMACSRRETLEQEMQACGAWLDELCGEAEREFLRALEVNRLRT